MTVHVGSFYNPHSPVVLLVHRNTRNHASSHLEMTCKMVDQNHTSELLAAAENRNQLRHDWPSDFIPGSVLKADPFMGGRWCPWKSKNHQERPPPRFAIGMQKKNNFNDLG